MSAPTHIPVPPRHVPQLLSTMASPSSDRDASSLSNPNVATFTHLSWTADVNFDTHVITAVATYDVLCNDETAGTATVAEAASSSELWLDTRGLTIGAVEIDGSEVADWTLEDGIKVRNNLCVVVRFYERRGQESIHFFHIRLVYRTTIIHLCLSWLEFYYSSDLASLL